MGDICNSSGGLGFKLHPSLVVDAVSGYPLGFSDVLVWNREQNGPNRFARAYKTLPVEQKESVKWIEASQRSKATLCEAAAVVIVQDREGDVFEQFLRVPDERTFLLVRSQTDRRLVSGDQKLWAVLGGATLLGQYDLQLPADAHKNKPARTALMAVRCVEVNVSCPVQDKTNRGQSVRVFAIEAKEVVDKEAGSACTPLHWRLLTTWPVKSYEDVLQVIEWYGCRWLIEEVFRVLKKEGFNIEASELENGWAIRKLSVMMLDVIVRLMQMHIAYQLPEGEGPPTAHAFSVEEQRCLSETGQKLQGSTRALQNPYCPDELKWAVWILARLGGWKGYQSQRPPGMTTLFRGLEKFYSLFEGWSLEKDGGTR